LQRIQVGDGVHADGGNHTAASALHIVEWIVAPWVWTVGPRHAHLERFDFHADRAVRADDRAGLERLVRYLLRPPLAQERLTRPADGRVVCTLGRPWHDGTRHLIFTPHEFLERLAAGATRLGMGRPDAAGVRHRCPRLRLRRPPALRRRHRRPAVITKILAHLGLPTEGPALTPARPPPQPEGFDFT
jgi:hypothetical protein